MPEVDMPVVTDGGPELAGTLTLPPGPGPHPAVLLLHASGPLDRDGNTTRNRLELGAPLAAELARHGIATLRYDRRGVGATPGDWRAAGFLDNQRDAAAALRALDARPDIRSDAVGVIGHSEGALHAMSLGAHQEVAAVVVLAGFAGTGEAALRWQAASITGGLPTAVRRLMRWLVDRQLSKVTATTTDVARVFGMRTNARWLRELLTHDSTPDLAHIKAPVLAITGGKDVQVDPADLDVIEHLVPGEVEVHRVPDLTHLLRRDPGRPSPLSYPRQLRRPVDAALLTQVAEWLSRQLP